MFNEIAATEGNPRWSALIQREQPLYSRSQDPRSEFARDYNRILHCTAYRRLKHKTQVFFAPKNDHICTRIEHVNHVTAISYTIAKALTLNTELTNAIATGHDLGHAPFGHEGERILNDIATNAAGYRFWHEKNSLWFVDNLETLTNPQNEHENLNLTYAVRDGIVCHCGEIDEPFLRPRKRQVDLSKVSKADQLQPFTWEGCVVKIADKIAFLGRDIEDAILLQVITPREFVRAYGDLRRYLSDDFGDVDLLEINNTILIHHFVTDLLRTSSPEAGIRLSDSHFELMKGIRRISEHLIYNNPRLKYYNKLARLMLESIYEALSLCYAVEKTLGRVESRLKHCHLLTDTFSDWLVKYTNIAEDKRKELRYKNKVVYDIADERSYYRAVVDYIAGMTDEFVIGLFTELTRFQ
jgi:dGTPase